MSGWAVNQQGGVRAVADVGDLREAETWSDTMPARLPDVVGAITNEYQHRIDAALAGKSSSMLREAAYLNSLVATGRTLTSEQAGDAALLGAVNAWETAMIVVRQQLIASGDVAAAQQDATWPSKPSGLTAEWLAGY